ncbi:MAG: 5'-nucleotidase C-terminal domain-containing protein [Spirochaetales bacterium]|nr:5'-nucleotidase C-terminal domain-containing protein [Spirochaetales bacterium]
MRNFSRKAIAVMLVLLAAMTFVFAQSISEVKHGEYYGKTVVIHSNDVHGALEGYAKIPTLRKFYEDKEAFVIVVDNGDFSQGNPYVSLAKGASAIYMMNIAGYDAVGLGNHEFDFGYPQLAENIKDANFKVLCADVLGPTGELLFQPYQVYTTGTGLKIGFFGIITPETQTKVNPSLIKGFRFPEGKDLYALSQQVVNQMRTEEKCDVIICIGHLGIDSSASPNTSIELMRNVNGIDFFIDGHSHSVFTEEEGLPIQQTGTKFANVGVIVIDNATGKIEDNFLIPAESIEDDPEVLAAAKQIIAEVDADYGVKFAESKVDLNGEKAPGNRNMETNNGDLITDAMLWAIVNNPSALEVPEENVVAITNGGGIRAWIRKGDVSMKDVNTVLPFGNTVAVVYVSGAELLEALEASTYCTPAAVGGFPQVAGMKYTIDTTKEYAPNAESYPESTYYGPSEIRRVTINEINGKPFDPAATYAVVTNNFCAVGGDTYYAFAAATSQFDTGLPLDEVLMDYITKVLNGVIGEQYAEPQGRITVIQ